MLCPRCGTENPEGAETCVHCSAVLEADSPDDELELVPVLVTNDASVLAVAKSLLEAEGVACEVQGESGQETLGLGPLPGASGPMRLMVGRRDEEAARGLLAQSVDPAETDE